jgi:hypothetical protein
MALQQAAFPDYDIKEVSKMDNRRLFQFYIALTETEKGLGGKLSESDSLLLNTTTWILEHEPLPNKMNFYKNMLNSGFSPEAQHLYYKNFLRLGND